MGLLVFFVGIAAIIGVSFALSPLAREWLKDVLNDGSGGTLIFGWMVEPRLFIHFFLTGTVLVLWTFCYALWMGFK
jgi:hypothetical protein